VTRRSLIQIQGRGENRKKTKWDSDKGRILKACSNSRQVIVYIEGGQIVYFEIDSLTGLLSENQTQFFETEICCLDIGHVPEGRQRCKFLVIGQQDKTVRVLSLEPESCLQKISTQGCPALASSVGLMTDGGRRSSDG
jgi:splicing factor 3B subunit 3